MTTEAAEQAAVFEWAEYHIGKHPELAYMFHPPNGGSRHAAEAANLKRQGVRSGVPDICLPVPRGGFHGLWIELKRDKYGKLSEPQRDYIRFLSDQGYKAGVCYGADEAIRAIEKYLRGERDYEQVNKTGQ